MIIGSHVSMSGKEMLLGSVKEALSYGANTFRILPVSLLINYALKKQKN